MRAKNIQVGVTGNREMVKVWCLSFTLAADPFAKRDFGMKYNWPNDGSPVDEANRKKIEQKIAAVIAAIDWDI
jgi:phosphoglucomutase